MNQTSCTTLYLIRRRCSGRRCREALRFLQSKFVSTGEKTDVRRQKTETAARAETAAPGPEVSGKHTGAADPHLGRIHSPAGAAQERGHWRHHRNVRFGAHRIARNSASGWKIRGTFHRAAARAICKPLHQPGAEL